jgi:hypothetical protein
MISISALPTETLSETLTPQARAFASGPTFLAFEPTPNVDDITNLRDLPTAQAASSKDRQRAFDSTLRIDNPNVHSFDTIDCASCHAAQVFRAIVGEKGLGMSSKAERFDPASLVGMASAKNTFTPTEETNFHAFSYHERAFGISQRVINETAGIVAYLNQPH